MEDPIDQLGEHDDGITLRAIAAQTDATGDGIALGTVLLTQGACFARRALVHGVREELPLLL